MSNLLLRVIVCAGLAFAAQASFSQFYWEKPVTISAKGAPLAEVLAKLFGLAGVSHKMDLSISGRITIHEENQKFAEVLRKVLLQVDCITDEKDGVWSVRRMRGSDLMTADQIRKSNWVSRRPPDMFLGDVRYQMADIHLVLRELFMGTGLEYKLDRKLDGLVTIWLKNVSFDVALSYILRQAGAAYRLDDGKYEIFRIRFE